jgi:hypothetical protein
MSSYLEIARFVLARLDSGRAIEPDAHCEKSEIRSTSAPISQSTGVPRAERDCTSDPLLSHALGAERREAGLLAHRVCSVAPDSRHPLIEQAVRAKLEVIEAEARSKGWPPELLWNANFWDCPRGLAAILDPADEITEVTSEYIAILKTKRDLLKFRRHAA